MKSSIDLQTNKLRALKKYYSSFSNISCSAEDVFETICKKFGEIQSKLDDIFHTEKRDFEKETALHIAYLEAQSVLECAYNEHIVFRKGYCL